MSYKANRLFCKQATKVQQQCDVSGMKTKAEKAEKENKNKVGKKEWTGGSIPEKWPKFVCSSIKPVEQ